MHSVNFYSFRVLTHKGSRASKKLNDLGLSNKKTAYELFVDYFTLYKNTPIEFGVSKLKYLWNNILNFTLITQKNHIWLYKSWKIWRKQ